jgi:hypothetical protein
MPEPLSDDRVVPSVLLGRAPDASGAMMASGMDVVVNERNETLDELLAS